jgi:large subunit ribosomal protein L21
LKIVLSLPTLTEVKGRAMYAIVDLVGRQVKVEKGMKVFVHSISGEAGQKVEFDKVLLIDDMGKVSIGAPVIAGAKVTATILEHLRGDKVIVFKKKRRKGYQKASGHRQYLTRIQIDDISAKAPKAKKAEVATEAPAENA